MTAEDLDKLDRIDETLTLPALEGLEPSVHVFDTPSLDALRLALTSGRPLLVRGEPGTGKSQLARAAAQALGRLFVWTVVDARTEARDLMWHYDAVSRLAEAQILGAVEKDPRTVRHELRQERFLTPGPLWWAFDWGSAQEQAALAQVAVRHRPPGDGSAKAAVVLVDEIDKADSSVPNGLLEALGHGRFACPGDKVVTCRGQRPLVLITTNEERALPDAFLRRCVVLHLGWPPDPDEFRRRLAARGRAHFPDLGDEILIKAANLLLEAREDVAGRGLSAPGGAEYLDLLRSLHQLAGEEVEKQKHWLGRLAEFALVKHPAEADG